MMSFPKNKTYFDRIAWTSETVQKEISDGLNIIGGVHQPLVTFFGSRRTPINHPDYVHACATATRCGQTGFGVMSGGGPGIMHAANTGAMAAGAPSLGIKAALLTEEANDDPVFTHEYSCHFLFVRRFLLTIKSTALIFYPGGFGTLNEFFECITLMRTHIVDEVPLICVGRAYWSELFAWLKNNSFRKQFPLAPPDVPQFLHIADTSEDVLRMINGKNDA